MPVEDQLNIIGVVPGDAGYNDFWQVVRVIVPDDYVPNSIASVAELGAADLETEETDIVVNCPVVPAGSTATLRYREAESTSLIRGWYDEKLIYYFSFEEAPLMAADGTVPVSPIYVTFNINPDQEGGGPGSGFRAEDDGVQTHNVIGTIPGEAGYSPLWSVNPYDNTDFDSVMDLESATAAHVLATGVANVNCPVVEIED
jgi:hypothetical protein